MPPEQVVIPLQDGHMKIVYDSKIDSVSEVNSSFDKGILRIAYTNKNRNGSYISKDAFNRSLPTIYNCPIVCNYMRDEDEIGGHDVEFVDTDDGLKMVNVTTPVGVVPESSHVYWDVIEDEGGTHEYLCAEVYIWKRQEAYEKIKRDGITKESMEITVLQGRRENGVYMIEDFEFTAFCLLGNVEPCFEGAALHMFSNDETEQFETRYQQMLEDFKASFSFVQQPHEGGVDNNTQSKGGKKLLEEKLDLLTKYGLTAEELDFSLEDLEFKDLEEKLKAMTETHNFNLTVGQMREAIVEALCVERITTEWGDYPRYCYVDFDMEASQVYAYDHNDWNLYGFVFSMNGDNVVIDFATAKRKKVSFVDFDEGEEEFNYDYMFNALLTPVETAYSALNEKFTETCNRLNESSASFESLKAEVDGLRQFKNDAMEAERKQQVEDLFANFSDLTGNEMFDELFNSHDDMSIEEIENKCYEIRGRAAKTAETFSVNTPTQTRIPAKAPKAEDTPYGGLFERFPPRI